MPTNYLANQNSAEKKDILELDDKINLFRSGKIPEEKFQHFRLTRGVYGQRQKGVQMIRIKIPFGKITCRQLKRIADISEKYSTGNLHITTRQNIQYHFVTLDNSPKVWEGLSEAGLTLREACGNTVRNITASATAGIDPDEPFDVSPVVQAVFEYFLRNPVCQDMGRKIKIAFSSSDKDSAFTYFHDFGFIPLVKYFSGKEEKGFKVVIGGGLGTRSIVAPLYEDFMPLEKILPFLEAALRVFDRYGERANRAKARIKFLIQKIGVDEFKRLVEIELKSLGPLSLELVEDNSQLTRLPAPEISVKEIGVENRELFALWRKTNVFEQKQKGFYAINVRVKLGNIPATDARKVADIVHTYAADDIRLTINQGFLIKFVKEEYLAAIYAELNKLNLADPGFDSTADITSCPGTDTCNLGITNSTALAGYLEGIIVDEYPELLEEQNLKIKISGCMNSCGQHMAASIGFHGSSIKKNMRVIPAMHVVLGGGVDPDGTGNVAERVSKIPTKRAPQVLRIILGDYNENALAGEYFNSYYRRLGKHYFATLLSPLADTEDIQDDELLDWGSKQAYFPVIGVGECAGVSYDMVSIILDDAKSKLFSARETLEENSFAESIYYSYTTMIIGAKAMLLTKDIRCNTHKGIIDDFQNNYINGKPFAGMNNFADEVLEINKRETGMEFAGSYLKKANNFLDAVTFDRENQLKEENIGDKKVIGSFYKA